MSDSCETCYFWRYNEKGYEGGGQCRRYPPERDGAASVLLSLYQTQSDDEQTSLPTWQHWWETWTAERDDVANSVFPSTRCDEWCGEHKTKVGGADVPMDEGAVENYAKEVSERIGKVKYRDSKQAGDLENLGGLEKESK